MVITKINYAFQMKDIISELKAGLGLSVSHALVVDKHKGNIWVESEPGKGAKFIIELSLSQEV